MLPPSIHDVLSPNKRLQHARPAGFLTPTSPDLRPTSPFRSFADLRCQIALSGHLPKRSCQGMVWPAPRAEECGSRTVCSSWAGPRRQSPTKPFGHRFVTVSARKHACSGSALSHEARSLSPPVRTPSPAVRQGIAFAPIPCSSAAGRFRDRKSTSCTGFVLCAEAAVQLSA